MLTDEGPEILGDENLNDGAITSIEGSLHQGEEVIAVAGFDFERKVAAVTSQRILIGEAGERGAKSYWYNQVNHIGRDGRTLVLEKLQGEEDRYQMGSDKTVGALVIKALRQRERSRSFQTEPAAPAASDMGEPAGIAERVRFWEEQDRINQALIPRVVQQAELLGKHVADHENLQVAAAGAAREAVEAAQEETRRQLADAVREREELGSQLEAAREGNRQLEGQLRSAQEERETLARHIETAEARGRELEQQLASAKDERNSLSEQLKEAQKEREEQANLMEQAGKERAEQEVRHQDAMTDLGAREKRMTLMAVGVGTLATAAGVAAIIMAVI